MVLTLMKKYAKKILVSEKELSDVNFERFKKTLPDITNNFCDSNNNMYLTVDS